MPNATQRPELTATAPADVPPLMTLLRQLYEAFYELDTPLRPQAVFGEGNERRAQAPYYLWRDLPIVYSVSSIGQRHTAYVCDPADVGGSFTLFDTCFDEMGDLRNGPIAEAVCNLAHRLAFTGESILTTDQACVALEDRAFSFGFLSPTIYCGTKAEVDGLKGHVLVGHPLNADLELEGGVSVQHAHIFEGARHFAAQVLCLALTTPNEASSGLPTDPEAIRRRGDYACSASDSLGKACQNEHHRLMAAVIVRASVTRISETSKEATLSLNYAVTYIPESEAVAEGWVWE